MTEYFGPEQAFFRSASVCMCLCLSVTTFYLNTIQPIFVKLRQYDPIENRDDTFIQFSKCCFDDVMVTIMYPFDCGNLTVATLLGSFFEIIDKVRSCRPMFEIENQQYLIFQK